MRRDVVVLIAIGLIGGGLGISWIYSRARESSRQKTCQENMRKLSLALFQYANKTTVNELPGYIHALARDDGFAYHDPRTGRTEPVSWVVMILPELGEKRLYDEWRSGESPGDGKRIGSPAIERTHRYLEYLVCPSDPPSDKSGTPLSYAVNTGIPDFPGSERNDLPRHPVRTGCLCEACGSKPEKESRAEPRDVLANGVFFDNFTKSKYFDPAVSVRQNTMTLADIADGKDKTILLAENVDAFDYTFVAAAGEEAFISAERRIGIVWAPETTFGPPPNGTLQAGTSPWGVTREITPRADMAPPQIKSLPTARPPRDSYRINVETGRGNGLNYDHSRPSSKHPGGVNVMFAGYQLVFMNDAVSYYVYVKLMTSNDLQAVTFDEDGKPRPLPSEFRFFQLRR